VLLVRHGRTPTTGSVLPGRAPGLHLSEDGKKEAAATAERVAALKAVAAVYSSPLERARETAEIIAARRGMGVQTESGLLEPVAEAWVVGSLGVAYDESADRILIVAEELTEGDDEEDEEDDAEEGGEEAEEAEAATAAATESPDTAKARFRLTRPQAAAFVERARALVQSGRPICRTCGLPIDPDGHPCPGTNGHLKH
jgi:uncharacterized repeat protein (TIGR03847 family)